MITASDLRTIIKQFCFIERDEIEAVGRLSDKAWHNWQADPHGQFMKMNDRQQGAVVASINRRLDVASRAAPRLIAAE